MIEHHRAVWQEMIGSGGPFAMTEIEVRGVPTRIFDSRRRHRRRAAGRGGRGRRGAVSGICARRGLAAQVLAERIAKHKIPTRFWFRNEQIPRNASGKFLKRELRAELIDT